MASAEVVHSDRDLVDLRDEKYNGPIVSGELSTGKKFEIRFPRKSAVQSGLHLIITYPGSSSLSIEESAEGFSALNSFASRHPLAQRFGYDFEQNFGQMLTTPEPHAHAIVPGDVQELISVPRTVNLAPETLGPSMQSGKLSSGRGYDIWISQQSDAHVPINLIIKYQGNTALSDQESAQGFVIVNSLASSQPSAQQFGYRYRQVFGPLLVDSDPFAFVMLPSSSEEREKVRRIVDPWNRADLSKP